MTWTEGTLQICDTIIIYGGYWGIIAFSAFVLLSVIVIILLSLILGTLLSSTVKELRD